MPRELVIIVGVIIVCAYISKKIYLKAKYKKTEKNSTILYERIDSLENELSALWIALVIYLIFNILCSYKFL